MDTPEQISALSNKKLFVLATVLGGNMTYHTYKLGQRIHHLLEVINLFWTKIKGDFEIFRVLSSKIKMCCGESDMEFIAWLMTVFQQIQNKLNKNVAAHSKSLSHYRIASFFSLKAFKIFVSCYIRQTTAAS